MRIAKLNQIFGMFLWYWPEESDPSIIDGSWKIPPVKQVA